ncbi:hypothetical protein D3C75_1032350 [compost metagenome]
MPYRQRHDGINHIAGMGNPRRALDAEETQEQVDQPFAVKHLSPYNGNRYAAAQERRHIVYGTVDAKTLQPLVEGHGYN